MKKCIIGILALTLMTGCNDESSESATNGGSVYVTNKLFSIANDVCASNGGLSKIVYAIPLFFADDNESGTIYSEFSPKPLSPKSVNYRCEKSKSSCKVSHPELVKMTVKCNTDNSLIVKFVRKEELL